MPREIRSTTDLPQAVQAALAQRAERRAAGDEVRAKETAVLTRLDEIVAGGGAYTAAGVRDAVVDLARIVRRNLRHLRHL